MNVEAQGQTVAESWPQWEGEVINGLYHLRRLLNDSDHSAVFVTECAAQEVPTAAIKIVPAERVTLAQLSHWRMAADLSSPHLVRLLDAGLCQLGGRQFLFVVTEYAEQTLSEVLLRRPLTGDEVLEMLPPILEALVFLHQKNLVQGGLKPTNLLVVNDQLKLASDSVRPAGEPRASFAEPSPYDPPEAESGRLFPAGDIWALGITMVEALTQRLPALPDGQSVATGLPTTISPALSNTIRRCLDHVASGRPTALDLEAQLKCGPEIVGVPLSQPATSDAPRVSPPENSPNPRGLAPVVATVVSLMAAVWGGSRLLQSYLNSRPVGESAGHSSLPQSAGTPTAASQAPAAIAPVPSGVAAPLVAAKRTTPKSAQRPGSRSPDQSVQPLADSSASVVHEQIPIVPRSALGTIHGHVKVAVLVTVNPSGDVVDANLENPGPSSYFAGLARESARKWKFAPADTQESREWLLKFEFARGGTTGHATAHRS